MVSHDYLYYCHYSCVDLSHNQLEDTEIVKGFGSMPSLVRNSITKLINVQYSYTDYGIGINNGISVLVTVVKFGPQLLGLN